MKQILALIRQNPFFSAVSVIGTAVSITFVMVIYMVYDIQTADLAPESHRSSMVYSSYGYSYRKSDRSNSNTGMSYRAVNAIFKELPGAELVTYLGPTYLRYCGESPARGMRRTVRQVDLNYWRVYDIPLVAGRLFSTEEFDACRDVVVIGEQLAREAFGSAEAAIGKNYFVNFRPKRIVGVTKDVSSLFTFAYGELWMPYSTRNSDLGSEGLRGDFEAVALVRPGVGEDERVLIRSAIEFDELEAVDIYTPRIDIVGIPVDMPKDEIAKIFADTGYSRLPVYEENIDQIIGILYQKDFYNFIYRSDVTIRDSVRPVIFTPKNKKIDDLLRELQQKKLHIAVAMDEYGGTAGIITLEDILEELVGEIWDEHDKIGRAHV